MPEKPTIAALIREKKTLFLILAVIALLVEAEIFAVAVMKSGRSSILQIKDPAGNVLHETDGENLSTFDKYYFEQAFGPLEDYNVQLITRERPFPFRAWLAAAVGIPVGAILLLAFIVKAYMAIFYRDHHEGELGPAAHQDIPETATRWERLLARISRFNIFTLGCLLLAGALLYWVVPNMLAYLGRVGLDTLVQYKWLFGGVGGVLALLVAWVIYLRYKLARKSIEVRGELDRYRLQLEMAPHTLEPLQISHQDKEPVFPPDSSQGPGEAPDPAPGNQIEDPPAVPPESRTPGIQRN